MDVISNFTSKKAAQKLNKKEMEVLTDPRAWATRRYVRTPQHDSERTHSHHILQVNLGSPFLLSWKLHGQWSTGACDTGNIVQLLSPGEKEQLLSDQEFDTLEIVFDIGFIDKILGKENFRFQSQYNLHDPVLTAFVKKLHESRHSVTEEKLYTQSLAMACAVHLAATYSVSNKKVFAPKGKLSSHQMRAVIEFARESIYKSVTLEELAACCHLSVFHFSRLFKNSVGISPYQFVLRMKIEHARNLIKRKQTIGDIAYSLGFTDSAHFCNIFKKLMGHSPLQSGFGGKSKNHRVAFPYANNNGVLKERWATLSQP